LCWLAGWLNDRRYSRRGRGRGRLGRRRRGNVGGDGNVRRGTDDRAIALGEGGIPKNDADERDETET